MKNKNNKGFTLIELIVTITIMGIISIMVFPNLTSMIKRNKQKKYQTYSDSLKRGAKLYIDNHEEDIWDINDSGCVTITYNKLKSEFLIKDYTDKNINCNNSNTFVKVEKNADKYRYQVSIKCIKDAKEEYTSNTTLSKTGCINIDS